MNNIALIDNPLHLKNILNRIGHINEKAIESYYNDKKMFGVDDLPLFIVYNENVGECEYIWVDEQYRNKGYAKLLINHFDIIKLCPVKSSIPFWEHNGFTCLKVLFDNPLIMINKNKCHYYTPSHKLINYLIVSDDKEQCNIHKLIFLLKVNYNNNPYYEEKIFKFVSKYYNKKEIIKYKNILPKNMMKLIETIILKDLK